MFNLFSIFKKNKRPIPADQDGGVAPLLQNTSDKPAEESVTEAEAQVHSAHTGASDGGNGGNGGE